MPQQPTNPQTNEPKKQNAPSPDKHERRFNKDEEREIEYPSQDDENFREETPFKAQPDVNQPRKSENPRNKN